MTGVAVFDLDGTLIDSAPLCALIINAMFEARGAARRVSLDETRRHVTAGGEALIAALMGEDAGDPARALAEFRGRYAAMPTPEESLYPGVREGLLALRGANVRLAVCSNKVQPLCDKVIGELDLAPLFDAVVGTGPGVPHKPDPAGLDLAVARSGGERRRCCLIGDAAPDFELSRRAQVPLIMVTYGYGDYDRDWPGAILAPSFDAVPALVLDRLDIRTAA